MTGTVPPWTAAEYLALAAAGDRERAVRFVLDLLDQGIEGDLVISEVLAASQREVGARWERAEWTVADEHLASGVTLAALEAIATSSPGRRPEGLALSVCAEGDWHGLPAQMFSEQLRCRGQDVRFLGASTPTDDLFQMLGRRRPDAVLVTCIMAPFFPGVASHVDTAHRQGVPVLVGGAAMTRERAVRLGADAWATDLDDALDVLSAWRRERPTVMAGPVALEMSALELEVRACELGDRALAELAFGYLRTQDYDVDQLERMREDLAWIVRFLAAAQLVDDPSVYVSYRRWLSRVVAARGIPAAALAAGLEALAPLVHPVAPAAARLLTDTTET